MVMLHDGWTHGKIKVEEKVESGRMTHACKRPPTTTVFDFFTRLLLRPFAIHIISQLQTLQQSTNSTVQDNEVRAA